MDNSVEKKYPSHFQKAWKDDPEFSPWLREVAGVCPPESGRDIFSSSSRSSPCRRDLHISPLSPHDIVLSMEPLSIAQKSVLLRGLGADWEILALHLGFNKADIDGFKHDGGPRLKNQVSQMLDTWCERNPGNPAAVATSLLPALRDMQRNDLAEDVETNSNLGSAGIAQISNIKRPVRYFQSRPVVEADISSSLQKHKIALLCGIHGSGKSQMALDYWAKHHDRSHQSVNWSISAASAEILIQGLLDLGSRLRMPRPNPDATLRDLCMAVLRCLHLELKSGKHFIIFDDASEECCLVIDECVRDVDADNVSVVVTSIFRNLVCAIPLTGFTRDEVLQFFHNDPFCEACLKSADILAFTDRTSKLPLAMASARAYMSKSKIDIEKYEKKLNSENERVKCAVWENQHLREYDQSLLGALLLNVEMVSKQFLDDNHGELLSAFQMTAFLSSSEVPLSFLMEGLNAEDEDEKELLADMFVEHLENMSIATITWFQADTVGGDTRLVSVHDAVRQALVLSFTKEEKLTKCKEFLFTIVGFTCDKDNRFLKDFVPKFFLINHLNAAETLCRAFRHLNAADSEMELLHSHVLDALGYHYAHDLYNIKGKDYFEEVIRNICKFAAIESEQLFIEDSQTLYEKLTSEKTVENISIDYLKKLKLYTVYKNDYFEAWYDFLSSPMESNEMAKMNFTEGRLSYEVINHLENVGVIIKPESFRKFYLVELLVSILYSHSRTFFLCDQESIHLKEKYFKCGSLAYSLGQKISSEFGVDILHGMITQRSFLLFFKNDRHDIKGNKKTDAEFKADLDEALNQYRQLVKDQKTYYQLGVLKSTPAVNIFHYLYCYKSIFRCLKNMHEISKDREMKAKTFKECHDSLQQMMDTLKRSEKHDHQGESLYYIEAASFLMLSDEEEHVSEAEKFLHQAVSLHKQNLPGQSLMRVASNKRWLCALENLVKIFSKKTDKRDSERAELIKEIRNYIDVEVDERCRRQAEAMISDLDVNETI